MGDDGQNAFRHSMEPSTADPDSDLLLLMLSPYDKKYAAAYRFINHDYD